MERLFAVIRSCGARWNHALPLEEQAGWPAHAAFMDALAEEGFVMLAGPLAGSPDFLLIFRAREAEEIVARLAEDPWTLEDLLIITRVSPWTLRLGRLS